MDKRECEVREIGLLLVVNEIHDAIVKQEQKGLWNDYVAQKLLPGPRL